MQFAEPNTPLDLLVQQPWSVDVTHDDDNGFVARVRELPDAIATAPTADELDREFWVAVRASIAARLEFGLSVPIVDGFNLRAAHIAPLAKMSYEPKTIGIGPTKALIA
jgi:predicted RNase H-like HicB family nuclease